MDYESQQACKLLRSEIKLFLQILKLQARKKQPASMDVNNQDLSKGYPRRSDNPDGIYISEGVVTNHDEVCYANARNTNENEVE